MAPTLRPCSGGCGAFVLRARTEALKWQELNPEPDPAGNTAVRVDQLDNVFARGLRKGEQAAPFETVYMPHKATCQVLAKVRQIRARQPAGSVTQLDAYRTAKGAAGSREAHPPGAPPGTARHRIPLRPPKRPMSPYDDDGGGEARCCSRCLAPDTFLTPGGVCADVAACQQVQPPIPGLDGDPRG